MGPVTRRRLHQSLHHYHQALQSLHQCLQDEACQPDHILITTLITVISEEQRALRRTLQDLCGEGFHHG